MEIWKDIIGYEDLYQISNTGRIKSKEKVIMTKKGTRVIPERILTTKNDLVVLKKHPFHVKNLMFIHFKNEYIESFMRSTTKPNEEWRDITDYVGLYQVSSLGRVRSLPRRSD